MKVFIQKNMLETAEGINLISFTELILKHKYPRKNVG